MSVVIVNGIELGDYDRVQRQLEIIADADLNGRTVIVYDDLSVWRLNTIQSIFWTILCCDCMRKLFFGTDTLRPHAVLLQLHPRIVSRPAILNVYNRAILNANLVLPSHHHIVYHEGVPVYGAQIFDEGRHIYASNVGISTRSHVAVGGGHERLVPVYSSSAVPARTNVSVLQRAATFDRRPSDAAVLRRTESMAPTTVNTAAGVGHVPVRRRESKPEPMPISDVRGIPAAGGARVAVGRRT